MSDSDRTASGHLQLRSGKRFDTWWARLRLPLADGIERQVRIRLGKNWTDRGRPANGYLTKKMAEAKLRELLVQADNGELDELKPSGLTFRKITEEWLDYVEHDRQRKPSTVFHYRAVTKELIERWGDKAAEDLTAEDIDALRQEMLKAGKSASTINKRRMYVFGIYKLAQRKHGLTTNPAVDVERQPERQTKLIEVYSPNEVFELARGADIVAQQAKCRAQERYIADWYSRLFIVAAFTGLRMGELRALRWRDVDFKKKLIYVRSNFVLATESLPKSGSARSVPLVAQAIDALQEQKQSSQLTEPHDLVFPNSSGSEFDDSKIRKAFKAAAEQVRLHPIRFHDLRHTFGTLAVNVWPLHKVQAYMGHADIKTTMIYVHHQSHEGDADLLAKYIDDQRETA